MHHSRFDNQGTEKHFSLVCLLAGLFTGLLAATVKDGSFVSQSLWISRLLLNLSLDSFLFSLSLLLLLQQSLTSLGHQQEDEEAAQQEAATHDPKLEGDGDHHEGCDQGDGVKDVDQHRQHLPVEVGGDDWAEWGKDDNDWNTDGEETPGVLLNSCRRHHLPPVEADAGVDGHQDDGGWGGDLLADSEEQGEDGEWADVDATSRHRAEDAAKETNGQEDGRLPSTKP